MKKVYVIGIIILLIVVNVSGIFVKETKETSTIGFEGNTLYVGGSGAGNYSTIQSAIDAASDGDTIFVYNGIYYENIVIDKSIDLIGESRENVIVDGGGTGNILDVTVDNVDISLFTIKNGEYGIRIYDSSSCSIMDCDSYDNSEYGIYLARATTSNITNCDSYNNQYGIYLWDSTNCKLKNNTIYNNVYNFGVDTGYSPDIQDFYHDIEPSNTIDGKPIWYLVEQNDLELNETYNFAYLGLVSCTNITIKNLDVSGILLANTTHSTINNVNSNNCKYGIYFFSSPNCSIMECNLYDNSAGINIMYSSSNCIIMDCDSYDNKYGIYVYSSPNTNIIDCDSYNNQFGIYLQESSNNVTECDSYNNQYGIFIDYSPNNNIINCSVYESSESGIWLYFSPDNNIVNCNVYDNSNVGIYPRKSPGCKFTDCILYNNMYGIFLRETPECTVTDCDSYNNQYGIYLYLGSNDNLIYHNNFVNNLEDNAYEVQCNLNNWDNGYPSGGNYWDDYTGVDNDGDGIGDTPYPIPGGNNEDGYPFMNPNGWIKPDLDCSGSLSWTDVAPGDTVSGTITVENIGENDSLLDWEIDSYPEWGEWTFDPASGTYLIAGDSIDIDVSVKAPNEEETTFTGEIVIVNSNNPIDTCTIDVSLATPVSQQITVFTILQKILECFPNAFLVFRYIFGF